MFKYTRFYGLRDKIIEFENNSETKTINCYIHIRERSTDDNGVTNIYTVGSRHVAQFKDSKSQFFKGDFDDETMNVVSNLLKEMLDELELDDTTQ
jgi:hypothetical protein